MSGRPIGSGRFARLVRDVPPHTEPARPNSSVIVPGGRCEMCACPTGVVHQHIVNVESRALKCTCRPCWLLFTESGAGGGRYRALRDRVARLDLEVGAATWNRLDVPVGMLFVFHSSAVDRAVAFYPSPAGATESALDLSAWAEVRAASPLVDGAEPDVEAVLVRRHEHPAGSPRTEAYLVPIDLCYALVGLVRQHWTGFDGGAEAHEQIEAFFADLNQRAVPSSAEAARPAARVGR